eukprot:UN25503
MNIFSLLYRGHNFFKIFKIIQKLVSAIAFRFCILSGNG